MNKRIQAIILAMVVFLHPALAIADSSPPAAVDDVASYQKAADQILDILVFRYSDAKSVVDYPSLFNALGALAGFGCQMAVKESFINTGIIQENAAFYIYKTPNGRHYYLSTLVDTQLEGNDKVKTSVLSLVSDAAHQVGAKTTPDVVAISEYNFKTMGTDNFGVPLITSKYPKMEMPIAVVNRNWLSMKNLFINDHVDTKFWGWTFALAAHDAILKHPKDLDPSLVQEVLMEAAIPMSTIDPRSLILQP